MVTFRSVGKSMHILSAYLGRGQRVALVGLLVGCALVSAEAVLAQPYPTRPIRQIIPYAPAGALDIIARIMAPQLAERLGQSVVVDNRPGAGAIIGTQAFAQAAPDGYTIMTANIAHGANPFLHKELPYNTANDFVPVALVAILPNVLVTHPSVPAKSVQEFIALAKAKSGGLTYGSAGIGSINHLTMALFANLTKIDVVHVPYKGGGPLITDLLAGHVQTAFTTIPPALSYVKGGQLRVLGITSPSVTLPNVPLVSESGVPGFDVSDWHGILAPAGTPPAIVQRLNREINAVLSEREVRERIEGLGATVGGGPPDRLGKLIKDQLALWGKAIPEAGIQAK